MTQARPKPISSAKRKRPTTPQERRAYLDRDERRRMLLDHAARLICQGDWARLKMSTLAEYAGTSRQLVYQHFPNLDALLAETARVVFSDLLERTKSVVNTETLPLPEAIRTAAQLSLDLPTGEGDALWQLLTGIKQGSKELNTLSQQIRELVIDLWAPRIMRDLHLKKPAARVQSWMLQMAFWGARQLVRDGLVTRKQALDQLEEMIRTSIPANNTRATGSA